MKRESPITIRFDSKTDVEKIKKAAELKHWSFNRFVVEAAKIAASQIIAVPNKNSEQASDELALNQ